MPIRLGNATREAEKSIADDLIRTAISKLIEGQKLLNKIVHNHIGVDGPVTINCNVCETTQPCDGAMSHFINGAWGLVCESCIYTQEKNLEPHEPLEMGDVE